MAVVGVAVAVVGQCWMRRMAVRWLVARVVAWGWWTIWQEGVLWAAAVEGQGGLLVEEGVPASGMQVVPSSGTKLKGRVALVWQVF